MELVAWEKRINSNLSAIQRAGCASVTYKDRFVLIVGGRFHDTFYLDCWSYDTSTGALNTLSTGPKNFHPRSYHTATLIDGVVWVIGGSDDDAIHADDAIWCFDVKTRVWTQPKLKGNLTLLRRTAHGACLHPTMPGCILLFGGYGIVNLHQSNNNPAAEVSLEPQWLSDLVLLNTHTNTVESITPKGGKLPISRAYHSFSAVGNLCIALFGRAGNQKLIPVKKSIAIYDAKSGIWLDIPDKDIKGTIPQVRSSHRACSVAGSGVVVFGGAPPAVSKKIDRLADMHFLKITTSPPVSNRRAASNNSTKYQLEWINCGDGEAPETGGGGAGGGGGSTRWPIGRGAHAQEYINGKVCLFGGYSRHEKYCTDVWEGLVVVEGTAATAAAGNAVRAPEGEPRVQDAVCNEPSAALKWKNSRNRVEKDGILQKILPNSAKRQRAGGEREGGEAGTNSVAPLETTTAAAAVVIVPAKKLKRQFIDPGKGNEEISAMPFNPPGTSSPTVVPGARRISALELEVKSLREALLEQRVKEASLLRETSSAKGDAFKLKQELQKADENWRKASGERDDWKLRFNDLEKFSKKAETEKTAAVNQAAAAQEKLQEAVRRCKATAIIAEQKQKALDDAAAHKAQLQSNTAALQSALDKTTVEMEKERQLRMSIQEQNLVLQTKMTTAETEKGDIKRQFEMERSSFNAIKMQLEAEQGRLQRELSSTKNNLAGAQRDLEASKRQEDKLESANALLQQDATVLKSRVQRLEGELRTAAEEWERGEAENKKLRDDVHRLQREMDDKQRSIDTEFDAIHRAIQRARDANAASGSRRQ